MYIKVGNTQQRLIIMVQWSNDEFAEALHIYIYECNEAKTVLQRLYIFKITSAMKQTSQELRNCPMGKEMLYWKKGFIENIPRIGKLPYGAKRGFIERKALWKKALLK